MENQGITPEVVETDKESKKIVWTGADGKFVRGNPGGGRAKGAISEANRIRHSAIKVFYKADGEQIIYEMLTHKEIKIRMEALKMIFSLVPKEIKATVDHEQVQINIFRADGSLFQSVSGNIIETKEGGES